MGKVLISLPEKLVVRLRAAIPQRQRSKIIAVLIEKEVEKREKALYDCALAVEQDQALKEEMQDWDPTIQDGLDNEPW